MTSSNRSFVLLALGCALFVLLGSSQVCHGGGSGDLYAVNTTGVMYEGCSASCGGGLQLQRLSNKFRPCNTFPCCEYNAVSPCYCDGFRRNGCGAREACVPDLGTCPMAGHLPVAQTDCMRHSWSACSELCGGGIQLNGCGEVRACNTFSCQLERVQHIDPLNGVQCPNGTLSSFDLSAMFLEIPIGTWGACSASCGGGTMQHSYGCEAPCNTDPCPYTEASPAGSRPLKEGHKCQLAGTMLRAGISSPGRYKEDLPLLAASMPYPPCGKDLDCMTWELAQNEMGFLDSGLCVNNTQFEYMENEGFGNTKEECMDLCKGDTNEVCAFDTETLPNECVANCMQLPFFFGKCDDSLAKYNVDLSGHVGLSLRDGDTCHRNPVIGTPECGMGLACIRITDSYIYENTHNFTHVIVDQRTESIDNFYAGICVPSTRGIGGYCGSNDDCESKFCRLGFCSTFTRQEGEQCEHGVPQCVPGTTCARHYTDAAARAHSGAPYATCVRLLDTEFVGEGEVCTTVKISDDTPQVVCEAGLSCFNEHVVPVHDGFTIPDTHFYGFCRNETVRAGGFGCSHCLPSEEFTADFFGGQVCSMRTNVTYANTCEAGCNQDADQLSSGPCGEVMALSHTGCSCEEDADHHDHHGFVCGEFGITFSSRCVAEHCGLEHATPGACNSSLFHIGKVHQDYNIPQTIAEGEPCDPISTEAICVSGLVCSVQANRMSREVHEDFGRWRAKVGSDDNNLEYTLGSMPGICMNLDKDFETNPDRECGKCTDALSGGNATAHLLENVCGEDGVTYQKCEAHCRQVAITKNEPCTYDLSTDVTIPEDVTDCGCVELDSLTPVCSLTGTTYRSQCHAKCAGLTEFWPGACMNEMGTKLVGQLCSLQAETFVQQGLMACATGLSCLSGRCAELERLPNCEKCEEMNMIDHVCGGGEEFLNPYCAVCAGEYNYVHGKCHSREYNDCDTKCTNSTSSPVCAGKMTYESSCHAICEGVSSWVGGHCQNDDCSVESCPAPGANELMFCGNDDQDYSLCQAKCSDVTIVKIGSCGETVAEAGLSKWDETLMDCAASCASTPQIPVCGSDGITYPSECFASVCARVGYVTGSCMSQQAPTVCEEFCNVFADTYINSIEVCDPSTNMTYDNACLANCMMINEFRTGTCDEWYEFLAPPPVPPPPPVVDLGDELRNRRDARRMEAARINNDSIQQRRMEQKMYEDEVRKRTMEYVAIAVVCVILVIFIGIFVLYKKGKFEGTKFGVILDQVGNKISNGFRYMTRKIGMKKNKNPSGNFLEMNEHFDYAQGRGRSESEGVTFDEGY